MNIILHIRIHTYTIYRKNQLGSMSGIFQKLCRRSQGLDPFGQANPPEPIGQIVSPLVETTEGRAEITVIRWLFSRGN